MTEQEMIHCAEHSRQVERAVAIMRRLRAPGGCPWDAEQTHESILSNLLEESYECIDAIRSGDDAHMREELGDVLLQVIFHAELAQERKAFDLSDIACELSEKLVRRHPHVFAQSQADDTEAVLNQWDAIKRTEKSAERLPYLHHCAEGLPALMKAYKLSSKVAKVGFDWPAAAETLEKVREELTEVEECLQQGESQAHLEEELGDMLFSMVNLCRKFGVDPELALSAANTKFTHRFNQLEECILSQNLTLQDASLEQMEEAWQHVKKNEH